MACDRKNEKWLPLKAKSKTVVFRLLKRTINKDQE